MKNVITVWKDGSNKTWSETDAHHAAQDPDWLVNTPLEQEEPVNLLDWLRSQDLLQYSQFTIDWVETVISDEDDRIESGESLSWKEEEGAIRYSAENVLSIMRDGIPDVEFFRRVISFGDEQG